MGTPAAERLAEKSSTAGTNVERLVGVSGHTDHARVVSTLYIYLAGYKGRMCLEEKNAQKKATPRRMPPKSATTLHTRTIQTWLQGFAEAFLFSLG